jgi:hypothetical protein
MSDINFRGPPYLGGVPPSAPWGVGQGSDLNAFQIDSNFWFLWQLILSVQSTIVAGIDYFSVVGDSFYVHLTDHMTLGPYPLPVAVWTYRGAWQPFTVYYPLDIITSGGATYIVQFQHTSAATFNPNANDGMGHNYYGLLLAAPGSYSPIGGEVGQVLTVTVPGGFTTPTMAWEYVLPSGGVVGDYLRLVDIGSPNGAAIAEWEPVFPSGGAAGYVLSQTDHPGVLEWIPLSAIPFPLEDLSDVTVTSVQPFDELFWTGSTWVNLGGTINTPATTGTVTINPGTQGKLFKITPTGDIIMNATTAPVGLVVVVEIITSGTVSYNIDFSGNFRATAILATGTSNGVYWTVTFMGDGSTLVEIGRAGPM